MAAIGLILGFASRRVGGWAEFRHERVAFTSALGSMALGIAAMVTESELVLALFLVSIVGLWVAAIYAHPDAGHSRHVHVAHQ